MVRSGLVWSDLVCSGLVWSVVCGVCVCVWCVCLNHSQHLGCAVTIVGLSEDLFLVNGMVYAWQQGGLTISVVTQFPTISR